MGWIDYYRLMERYNGDLTNATMQELDAAKRANPNDWRSAWQLAREKYIRQTLHDFAMTYRVESRESRDASLDAVMRKLPFMS